MGIGIRGKVFAAVATVAILAVSLQSWWLPARTQALLADLDRAEVVRAIADLQRTVEVEANRVGTLATQWAMTDATKEFARGGNPDYTDTQLVPTLLHSFQIDAVLVVGPDGGLMASLAEPGLDPVGLDALATLATELPPDPSGTAAGMVGYATSSWLAGVATITDLAGTAAGSAQLVFAVEVDEDRLRAWAPNAAVGPTVTTTPPADTPREEGDELVHAGAVTTLHGDPVFVVCRHPRTASLSGRSDVESLRWLVLLSGGLASLVFAAWIDRMVVRRIRRLGHDVDRIRAGDEGEVEVTGSDELTQVEESLNRLLGRLHEGQEELARQNLELEESNRARDAFVSMISHELRTPLTAILGFTDTMRTRWDSLDERQRLAMIDRVAHQAKNLDGLVGDLLALRRAQGPMLPGGPTVVDPAVASIIDDLPNHLADHVRLVRDATDAMVPLGEEGLRRVLTNLLMNAHKYGEPPFDVTTTMAGRGVRLVVSDHGPGVPDEFVGSLFEPFTQASGGSQTTGAAGVGLGLSIVRSLVEAVGGTISYRSAPAGGAQFLVELPLVVPEHSVEPARGGDPG